MMKRRIIGLILVVVMLTLTLAGCASYSIANDDLSGYTTDFEANKALFDKIFAKIVIEDGDFGTDDAERAKKVIENIYTSFASKADTDDKKTEGKIGAYDLLYYCYYVTATIEEGGATEYFYMDSMKEASAIKLQLGLTDEDDEIAEAIRAAFVDFEFASDNRYSTKSAGTTKPGDIVFVSYKYTVATDEGGESPSKTVTNQIVTVGEGTDTFAGILNGKAVGTALTDEYTMTETRGTVTYTDVKINWIANMYEDKAITFTHVPDEKTEQKNAEGTKRDLNGKTLTYHVFPVSYVSVDEFNATNVINVLLGDDITPDAFYSIIFGDEYAGLHESHEGHDHTEEEQAENDKLYAELQDMLKPYETKDDDGNTVTLAELIERLADEQAALADAEKALETATTTLETKKAAQKSAQDAYNAAGGENGATDDQKNNLNNANLALDTAQDEYDVKKKAYDKALAARDKTVNDTILKFDNAESLIVNGYKISTYNYLQEKYNEEIKMNLAKEIYYFINKYITVSGAPEKAVEKVYEQLLEGYEYDFYTGKDSSSSITNYKKYGASFEKFLIAMVNDDIKSIDKDAANALELAKNALHEHAKEQLLPIIRIYALAKAEGVFVDDAAFEEYKKDPNSSYSYNEYYYGEDNARYAHQFDELLNYYLESTEDEAEADANGYVKITVKYNKITEVAFGDPASTEKADK